MKHETEILKRISEQLKKEFQDEFLSLYAFGSKVRGDHNEMSDFDILVIVKDKTPELEDKIMDIFVKEELKSSLFFTPLIKDFRAFDLEKKYNTPFYQNIMSQGVLL